MPPAISNACTCLPIWIFKVLTHSSQFSHPFPSLQLSGGARAILFLSTLLEAQRSLVPCSQGLRSRTTTGTWLCGCPVKRRAFPRCLAEWLRVLGAPVVRPLSQEAPGWTLWERLPAYFLPSHVPPNILLPLPSTAVFPQSGEGVLVSSWARHYVWGVCCGWAHDETAAECLCSVCWRWKHLH